jgi:copper chaperone
MLGGVGHAAAIPPIHKEGHHMIEFQVEGMSCRHCVAAVTKAVQALDPDARVQVELQSGRVQVESIQNADALSTAIADAGYTVNGV